MKNEFIKSPLNYTGNKNRIYDQISKFFPKNIDTMVDLFCGGATVGLNTSCEKIYFIDFNNRVISLLKFLAKQDEEKIISKIERILKKYNLSFSYKYGYKKYRAQCGNAKDNNGLKDYNSNGYYLLRSDYNFLVNKNTDKANLLLYILMVYSFNNDIRFNAAGEFNLPIGKTDMNKSNISKLLNYIKKTKKLNCEFLCMSFEEKGIDSVLEKADFVYMDPPYLITDAVYNTGWTSEMERRLLSFMDLLIKKRINFALSNVLSKGNKTNILLESWISQRNVKVIDIDYNYRSASYNKKNREIAEREVLIVYENK